MQIQATGALVGVRADTAQMHNSFNVGLLNGLFVVGTDPFEGRYKINILIKNRTDAFLGLHQIDDVGADEGVDQEINVKE